jgi:hypothetical protein
MNDSIAYLWNQIPIKFRWVIGTAVLLWMMPLSVRDWFNEKVDMRIHAAIGPMKEMRDQQINEIKSDISDIKEEVRDSRSEVRAIGIHLMGADKLERMTANNGGR